MTAACQAASYIESFTNSTGGNVGHSNTAVGWKAANSSLATDVSTNNGNNNGGFLISNVNGAGGSAGYGAKAGNVNGGTSNPYGLAYTEEVATLSISTSTITSISFQSRNSNATDIFRIVVGLDTGSGTQWYATNTTFTSASGTTWGGHNFSFVTTGSEWRALTFTPENSLALGSTLGTSLPSGTLTSAGLFLSGSAGGDLADVMRYDEFTINYIPEPSTAALGVLAFGSCALGRRRPQGSSKV